MEDMCPIPYPSKQQTDSRLLSNFENNAPIKISFALPEYIVYADTLLIGLWDVSTHLLAYQ